MNHIRASHLVNYYIQIQGGKTHAVTKSQTNLHEAGRTFMVMCFVIRTAISELLHVLHVWDNDRLFLVSTCFTTPTFMALSAH